MTTHRLPIAGTEDAKVLMAALEQFVQNQEEYVEGEDKPDPTEVRKLEVAQSMMTQLEAEFLSAVGI